MPCPGRRDRRGAGDRGARAGSGRAADGHPRSAVRLPRCGSFCRGDGRAGAPSPSVRSDADQSNSSAVLGESVLLKVYRRLEAGLNPELELVAFLTEEAGFGAVPPLAGFAEMVSVDAGTSTVAIAQAFVADATDAYESVAEALTAWLLAPGEVSVEFATEVAADLGALTAGLHAALADARGIARLRAARRRPATSCAPGAERRGPSCRARSTSRPARPGRCCATWRRGSWRSSRVFEALPEPAAADPGPRRLPPRPGPDRARRLPDRRLRGRAASSARGATRAPEPAARRRLDAAIARPRRT